MTEVTIEIDSACKTWIAGLRVRGSDVSSDLYPNSATLEEQLDAGQYEVVFASHTNPRDTTTTITVSAAGGSSRSKTISVDDDGDLLDIFYFRITSAGDVK